MWERNYERSSFGLTEQKIAGRILNYNLMSWHTNQLTSKTALEGQEGRKFFYMGATWVQFLHLDRDINHAAIRALNSL